MGHYAFLMLNLSGNPNEAYTSDAIAAGAKPVFNIRQVFDSTPWFTIPGP